MFARGAEQEGASEAVQLASEISRGIRKLKDQRITPCLEDFEPNSDVTFVLTKHKGILSCLRSFENDRGEARKATAQLQELRGDLHSLATALSRQIRPRGGHDAERAAFGGLQSCRGEGVEPVMDEQSQSFEPDANAIDKKRRILWYNWFFVACLITFVEARVPSKFYGLKWRLTLAVKVANELVNRAFVTCGISAFHVLDACSAVPYLLGGSRNVHAPPQDVAQMVYARLSREYSDIFPDESTEPIFLPVFLIADVTCSSGHEVCDKIGLSEVGGRLRGDSLEILRRGVGMCMAVPAQSMADLLWRGPPLWLPGCDPSSAAITNKLPPESFEMLAVVRNLTAGSQN